MLMRLYHGRYTEQIEIADAATILMVGLIFDRSSVLDFARYLRVLAVGRMAAPGHSLHIAMSVQCPLRCQPRTFRCLAATGVQRHFQTHAPQQIRPKKRCPHPWHIGWPRGRDGRDIISPAQFR
jgi:hypothetical protein